MTDVKIFNSPMFGELRVTRNEKGALLFCLKDVCDSLGLQVGATAKRLGGDINSTNVPKREHNHPYLSSINVGVVTGKKSDGTNAIQTISMYFVTEPDLYRCIFQSRKPTARKFQDWVFNEVLPSLRTTGGYIATTQNDTPESIMARALKIADETLKRHEQRVRELETQTEQQAQTIDIQQKELTVAAPKVRYYDDTLASVDFVTTQQIANEIGMNANVLSKKLEEISILYNQSRQWLLKMPYKTWNLHGTRTFPYLHNDGTKGSRVYTVWNQRGRRFILALYNNDFNVKLAIKDLKGETHA